jgi:hypothetical protein
LKGRRRRTLRSSTRGSPRGCMPASTHSVPGGTGKSCTPRCGTCGRPALPGSWCCGSGPAGARGLIAVRQLLGRAPCSPYRSSGTSSR